MPDSSTVLLRESVAHQLQLTGHPLELAPVNVKNLEGYLELNAPPAERLSPHSGWRWCEVCERSLVGTSDDFTLNGDAKAEHCFRIIDRSSFTVLSESLVDEVRRLGCSGLDVSPLH